MTTLVDGLALAVTTGGLIAGALVLSRTGDVPAALAVLLDLFTAAGLLRLAGAPSAQRLGGAAAVILIRRLASLGFRISRQARTARPGR